MLCICLFLLFAPLSFLSSLNQSRLFLPVESFFLLQSTSEPSIQPQAEVNISFFLWVSSSFLWQPTMPLSFIHFAKLHNLHHFLPNPGTYSNPFRRLSFISPFVFFLSDKLFSNVWPSWNIRYLHLIYKYILRPPLWVSRWPDGEPLAGRCPAVAVVG